MASAQKCGGVQKKITPNITSAGQLDRAGDRGPADHHRHAARRAAPDDVLRRAPLEQQRVDQHVERDRRHREPGGQPVGGQPQPDGAERAEHQPEHQRVRRRHLPLASGRARGALHLDVDVGVDHAVQRVRAGRGHRPADQRGEDQPDRRDAPLGEEHRRHRDDQQLLDDAGLGEAEVGAHGVAGTGAAPAAPALGPAPGELAAGLDPGWDTGTLTGGYLAQGSARTARRGVLRRVLQPVDGNRGRHAAVAVAGKRGPGGPPAHRSVRIGLVPAQDIVR